MSFVDDAMKQRVKAITVITEQYLLAIFYQRNYSNAYIPAMEMV